MSILVFERCQDGMILACDGVAYNDEGVVTGIASKIFTMPELDCAFGWTGRADFGFRLRAAVAGAVTCFDQLVADLPTIAKRVHALDRRKHAKDKEKKASVVVAGWSTERSQYEAYRIVSYGKKSKDASGSETVLQPWTMTPIKHWFWASHEISEEAKEKWLFNHPPKLSEEGDTSCRYISACRDDSGMTRDGRPYCAGGFIQIVQVKRDMTYSWIAHRWDEDQVGRPIDPEAGLAWKSHVEEVREHRKQDAA